MFVTFINIILLVSMQNLGSLDKYNYVYDYRLMQDVCTVNIFN